MLVAARGASRARGEPPRGSTPPYYSRKRFSQRKIRTRLPRPARPVPRLRVSRLRCVACGARASEASEAFAFVREARAFRLAELALAATERPDSVVRKVRARRLLEKFFTTRKKARRSGGASARRRRPAGFVRGGDVALELVGASHESDERAHSDSGGILRKNPEKNSNHPMNQPLLPFGLAGARARRRRRAASSPPRAGRARRSAAAPRSTGSRDAPGTRVTQRTSPPVSPAGDGGSFFRREPSRHAFADALRRDVLAAPSPRRRRAPAPKWKHVFGGARASRARRRPRAARARRAPRGGGHRRARRGRAGAVRVEDPGRRRGASRTPRGTRKKNDSKRRDGNGDCARRRL